MRRITIGLVSLFLMLSLGLRSQASSPQTGAEYRRLRVYVGEVKGDVDLVKPVRSQLVDELVKRGVALVASEEEADVTLEASGVHRTGTPVMLHTRRTMSIVIRGELEVIARDGRKLSGIDVSSKRWALSETASFADAGASRVARKLRQIPPPMAANPRY